MIDLAAKGAFLYGAAFFLGLFLSGNHSAIVCGLVGAAAAYVAQIAEAYRLASGAPIMQLVMFCAWAVSLISACAGFIAVIGG